MKTCHAEINRIYCDHCRRCVWEWLPERDGTDESQWLPPCDCPKCGVEWKWQSLENAMGDIKDWILQTNTEVVFG